MIGEFTVPSKRKMSNSEYHQHPAVGSSDLKLILRSTKHYQYIKENRPEPSPAMRLGTLVHLAMLEPGLFKKFRVMPDFAGKGSRAEKEAWLIANHGELIVTAEELEAVKGALHSVSEHALAPKLLAGGAAEESLFWQDGGTGIVLKCRPDFIKKGGILVDVKTCQDASLSEFQKAITNYKYHLQAAHYLAGATAVTGTKHEDFIIIAVEKTPPFGVQVFQLDEQTIEKGDELRRRALLRLKAAKDSGIWPAYSEEIVPINLTPWGWAE